MQNKIKEIQIYFKDQIIAGNFTYLIEKGKIKVKIDGYNFLFLTNGGAVFQAIFGTPEEHFMDLSFSQEEQTQIGKIFEKIILENKSESEKEKDLKEFERIKKLYNL